VAEFRLYSAYLAFQVYVSIFSLVYPFLGELLACASSHGRWTCCLEIETRTKFLLEQFMKLRNHLNDQLRYHYGAHP